MVYLVKSKRGKKTYYYLAEKIKLEKGKRKEIRKYIGSKKLSEKRIEILSSKFKKEVEKLKLKLIGYNYLTKDEIKKNNNINNEFTKRFERLNPTEKKQFEQNFLNVFVYNSNSIEGSTLTPKEVRLLLEEGISPNKSIEDVLEAKNAQKTLDYIKKTDTELNEKFVLKLHEIYFKDTMPYIAGKFKTKDNLVIGAKFRTSPARYVITDMKNYFKEYSKLKKILHPLELAAWGHWKLENIHPFQDGNGRIGRVLMNYILYRNKYQMIDIKTKEKQKYFKILEKCDRENSAEPLAHFLVKRFDKQYKKALISGRT